MGQPGNTLVNFLGLTTRWDFPSSTFSLQALTAHYYKILQLFIYVISKVGFVYASHLFYKKFFFFEIEILITLPVNIDETTFYKFYRVGTLTDSVLNIKQQYIMRIGLKKIQFSNIFFLQTANWVLIYFLANSLFNLKKLKRKYFEIDEITLVNWLLFLTFKYYYIFFIYNMYNLI